MSKQDSSEGPKGQFESKASDSQKNEKSEKQKTDTDSKGFTPAEDDRKITEEDFDEFVASEKMAKLKKFIKVCCFRFSLDGETAKDICSQTLADVLRAIHGRKIYESKFEGLCNTVAYRLILRELKVRKKNGYGGSYSKADDDEQQEFDIDSMPDRKCASPEAIACSKDAVAKLFAKLHPKEKQIFIMDYAEFSDKEIAEQLKISRENVRMIRYRAIQRLRKYRANNENIYRR